jgi:hypothetical protein
MEITINGVPADITLETEKTMGEFLSGLESWLENSGHYLSGLAVDGRQFGAEAIPGAFGMDLDRIGSIDVKTSTWSVFLLEALCTARHILEAYEAASFEERRGLAETWKESAAARFLSENVPDLYENCGRFFAGEGLSFQENLVLAEERIREAEDPPGELSHIEPAAAAFVKRLEDLPLDIQTGKDGRAAETVSLFTYFAEKLFRLFSLLKQRGLKADAFSVEGIPAAAFIEEFNAAIGELLAAYETKDAVLLGDLAEYELAPRLWKFYSALKTAVPED